jgi:hypothetical protein
MKPLAERIRTVREFHRWLFTEHRAYAQCPVPVDALADPVLRETY